MPPGLFDPNATGRITPLGNFTGFEDSIEYFFGLAPMPQTNAAGLGLYEADIVAFASGCPEVAASVVYLKGGPVNNVTGGLIPGSPTTTLKQVGSLSSRRYEIRVLIYRFTRSPSGNSTPRGSFSSTMPGSRTCSSGRASPTASISRTGRFSRAPSSNLSAQPSRSSAQAKTRSTRTSTTAPLSYWRSLSAPLTKYGLTTSSAASSTYSSRQSDRM